MKGKHAAVHHLTRNYLENLHCIGGVKRVQRANTASIRNLNDLLTLPEVVAEPFETLIKTVSAGGTGGLDVPSALPEAVKAKLVGNLGGVHGIRQILLVGENQEKSVPQLILVQHPLELLAGLRHTLSIVGVHDENDTLGVLEVMAPEGTDLVLSTNIPDGEGDVLVFDSLDIETNGGDGGDDFSELQFVQDGSFTGGIQSNHENSHLLLPEQPRQQLRNGHTHLDDF